MLIGGGLANGDISPDDDRCRFMPRILYHLALRQCLVYLIIKPLAVDFYRLSLRFGHERIAEFRFAPAQFTRTVKVLVQCHFNSPHSQSRAAGLDLYQFPLVLIGQIL
ncbi:MAG: hypothetical protein DID92_2727743977 [Candidatus Nitrotoga sp. SPKER]|nr:MAG: hypothetical protein DID92_2727743977 [Candidatus Nitrotoga sp. SPKER]